MRLNQHTPLPAAISRPNYPREQIRAGIVHLGVGAFHRAHQAWYTEQALRGYGGDWAITGVSLRSSAVRDQLAPQDYLYTLEVRHGEHRRRQLIGAIKQVLVASEQAEQVIAALSGADTKVVTLTITEKGYCLSNSEGLLDQQHPDIQHDYRQPCQPRSALGFLAAAMARRKQQQLPGLTVISCDNIAGNGSKLRRALLQFSKVLDTELAQWIDQHCRFPNTMVDRIVPATTPADLAQLQQYCGYQDQAAVFTEPFSQWVIEENFAGPVPPWNQVGAQYVQDVAAFETMKLRLLNASHSAIAYIGAVTGLNTVDQVIGKPALRQFIETLMREEAAPSLNVPADFDLGNYQQQLLQRFANSALHHRCQQIAMDGSQKIPNRLLPILRWQLEHQGSIKLTTAALAAWLRYLEGVDEAGQTYAIHDPMVEQLAAIYHRHGGKATSALKEILEQEALFPEDLSRDPRLMNALSHWLERFQQQGIIQSLRVTSQTCPV